MTWQGINRGITSVSEDMGASEYQQNTRMTVKGELQRRPGMAPANFSPQGTAALGMVGAFPTSGPYGMIVDTSGTVNGFPITMPIWQPPQLRPPIPGGDGWVFGPYLNGNGSVYWAQGSCPGSFSVSVPTTGTVDVIVRRWRIDLSASYQVGARIQVNLGPGGGGTIAVPQDSFFPTVQCQYDVFNGNIYGVSAPGCG